MQYRPTIKEIDDFIVAGLFEDVREGDHTSLACIPAGAQSKAKLLVKDDGVLAGVEFAKRVFKHVDPESKIDIYIEDGAQIKKGEIAFIIEANSIALLKAERLVLNVMQRMSGIATLSSVYAKEVEGLGTKVLDTRKTTPLIRAFEKWAVNIGGCYNYRFGLYDRFMIKDNHIDACGDVEKAIEAINNYNKDNNLNLESTVEVRDFGELEKVLHIGKINRIMLDNFEPDKIRKALAIIDGRFETEASGGINLSNLKEYAETGVDYVSVGALTHSVMSLDLSLKIIK